MIEINTNRIHETVRLIAGNDKLLLEINLDPMATMGGVSDIMDKLNATKADDEDGIRKLAEDFAVLLFGKAQATEYMHFYGGEGVAALNAITKVFVEAIQPKLTAAQETAGRKSIRRKLRALMRK